MAEKLTLESLLSICGNVDLSKERIRLVRHKLSDDISDLARFDAYHRLSDSERLAMIEDTDLVTAEEKLAALRSNDVLVGMATAEMGDDKLKDATLVLVFASTGGYSAEYLAAFRIGRSTMEDYLSSPEYKPLISCPPPPKFRDFLQECVATIPQLGLSKRIRPNCNYYKLEQDKSVLPKLEKRLVIDWPSPISWVQSGLDKEVIEIRPRGFYKEFTDYFDVNLSFHELHEIVKRSDANTVWESKLRAVSGVYIILDQSTGEQYIGSAYGSDGMWGRWSCYATDGHGGNKLLKKVIESDGNRKNRFQFSILKVMDKSSPTKDVLEAERLLKIKLGTRVHGLNAN